MPNNDSQLGEVAQLEALLAYREREEWELEDSADVEDLISTEAVSASGQELAGRLSERAIQLIIDYETGGKAFYENHYKSRPVWPKESSGITIGCGYDLGYVSLESYRRDWAALAAGLSGPQRKAMEACIGFHSGKDSQDKMKQLLASVQDIIVSWTLSVAVFNATTLPKFAQITNAALPNCGVLNGDCFGALVSLTFNRGASYSKAHDPAKDPKDRYREMRGIKMAMTSRNFAAIPKLMKDMIRIWVGTQIETGMRRRRTDEANLFSDGLAQVGAALSERTKESVPITEMVAAAETPATGAGRAIPPDADSWNGPGDEEAWVETTEDDVEQAVLEGAFIEAAAAGATWGADTIQPDYSHLGGDLAKGVAFSLVADDLALLAQCNDFDVAALGEDTPVLFGLRGAGIVKDHDNTSGVTLIDQRPDHSTPRCTIGAWDRKNGKVRVFPASTVPNQNAVALFKAKGTAGNLLPTGLYQYVCGAHITSKTTPGCFLLRKPNMEKRVAVVRRSKNDLIYQRTDVVDRCLPGDNIHPTFFSAPVGFSSLGCQTIVGTFKNGAHQGPWSKFRAAAGLTDANGSPGKRYIYMLLTGAEARLASQLRRDGLAKDPVAKRRLRRLRAGSSGEAVKRLQAKLGNDKPDGDFGASTAETLHKFQSALAAGNGSDGIFSPDMDATLGWGVFGTIGA